MNTGLKKGRVSAVSSPVMKGNDTLITLPDVMNLRHTDVNPS